MCVAELVEKDRGSRMKGRGAVGSMQLVSALLLFLLGSRCISVPSLKASHEAQAHVQTLLNFLDGQVILVAEACTPSCSRLSFPRLLLEPAVMGALPALPRLIRVDDFEPF